VYSDTYEINDGDFKHIFKIAAHDRFNYWKERIQFYYNADRKCAKRHNFDPDYPAIALYHRSDVTPSFLQSPEDDDQMMNFIQLKNWVSISVVEVD
jgi:hypothetical protein